MRPKILMEAKLNISELSIGQASISISLLFNVNISACELMDNCFEVGVNSGLLVTGRVFLLLLLLLLFFSSSTFLFIFFKNPKRWTIIAGESWNSGIRLRRGTPTL